MGDVTRRRFLAQTTVGAGLTLAGAMAIRQGAPPRPDLERAFGAETTAGRALRGPSLPNMALAGWSSGPLVVHVRDVAAGEIAVLVGTRELVYQDAELVARLVQAAQQSAAGEA